jgi:hypothetical protein
MPYNTDEIHYIAEVIERLADAHQRHTPHFFTEEIFSFKYLQNHLRSKQITGFSALVASAKRTAHITAHLRGNAQRVAVVVPHYDCFYGVFVV